MSLDDAVAMAGTYSKVLVAAPDERTRRLAEMRAALEARFAGADTVEIPMRSRCWRGDRIPRG